MADNSTTITNGSPDISLSNAAGVAKEAAAAFELGVEAYLWGYPLVLMARTKGVFTDPTRRGTVPVNVLQHGDRLWDHRDRAVVKPNNDTLYSIAWLDLSGEPVRLTVPEVPRYYSFQVLDAYTNTVTYVGTRTTGSGPGTFLIAGPDWTGDAPSGTRVLRSPTSMAWMIGRTVLDGPEDLPTASALIRTYELTGPAPAATDGEPAPAPSPHTIGESGLGFFDELAAALEGNPPPVSDTALLERLAAAGIEPGRTPSKELRPGATRDALAKSVEFAHEWLSSRSGRRGPQNPVWPYRLDIGSYGTDHVLRAAIALRGLGAVTAEEAIYSTTGYDGAGDRLDGRNTYVLRFPPDRLPPVDAFWSITLYDDEDFLIPNPIDRYSIGDRTPGLVHDEDGGLSITVSHERPASTANWLPAPAATFELTLRCYLPQQSMLDGQYVVPPLTRA